MDMKNEIKYCSVCEVPLQLHGTCCGWRNANVIMQPTNEIESEWKRSAEEAMGVKFLTDNSIVTVMRPTLQQSDVSGRSEQLPLADVSKKADKIGREFKKKWEAKYVGFGDGSSIDLWWRHKIEDAFSGNGR